MNEREGVDMASRTTHTNHCKLYCNSYCRLFTWLKTRIARLGEGVFATTDTYARQQGWQITSTQAGLGRRYRHPGFDTLATCSRCHSRGTDGPGSACQTCNGTGRIILQPPADLSARASA
jgi:hypothetical protein